MSIKRIYIYSINNSRTLYNMSKAQSNKEIPQALRWQDVDKYLKKSLTRYVGKAESYKTQIEENGRTIDRVFKHKKFICWYSRKFEFNEFYHTFGTPGIWFHGYLPIADFGKPEFDYFEPGYGYYDFQIKDLKHFMEILDVMKKTNDILGNENDCLIGAHYERR